ncbi:AAA domain protein [Deinococcus aerius]|uniref:AAA domain protein n=1 Tax=Deinococcus aerius TaxID=200253 RepID=A0A2I9D7W3_9DEIO|nr:AAA family ATPase [Deinococcus aerius]GBF06876.1 AAA domain protein [Deinococcus aerius]
MILDKIQINSYRSIIGVTLHISPTGLTTVCGVNNVGKTNILRAIKMFFDANLQEFVAEDDVPYHIERGSRGGNYKVDIKAFFIDGQDTIEISQKYIPQAPNRESSLHITGVKTSGSGSRKTKHVLSEKDCLDVIYSFRIYFIEASRTDLNMLVQDIFLEELLPDIDRKKSKQTQGLREIETFINTSQQILKGIENGITESIKHFTMNVEGVSSQQWEAKVAFPEFLKIRQAISRLVSLTVSDANDKELEFKGSGVQKIILLAMMRYLSQKEDGGIIWLLDEPEAFLQPSLQKEVFKQLRTLGSSFPIVITTHSPHFVDINDLTNTNLVTARYETKVFERKKTRKYIATLTQISPLKGYEKIEAIKNQLGIERSDAWVVAPFNILVEGEEDKNYLTAIYNKLGKHVPNILIAGSATKIKGYVQFLHEFTKENPTRPTVLCLFDHDSAGRDNYRDIRPEKYVNMNVVKEFTVRQDKSQGNNLNYEFEDAFPSEILIEAVNSFLKMKQYKKILSSSLTHRYSQANNDKPVMDILKDAVYQRNQDKPRLNLQDDGVKRYVNIYICRKLNEMSQEEFESMFDPQSGLIALINNLDKHMS